MARKHELRRRERMESLVREQKPRGAREDARASDKTQMPAATGRRAGRGVGIAICGLLILSTVLVFVQTARHDFVNCDDDDYIYQNVQIQRGLTADSIQWAVTQPHSANWHPLTWMSHALDWQLFGKWNTDLHRYVNSWPGGHHLVNLALHALCAVLLFLVFQSMTACTWPSAAVAALFVVHPQHVESVAWASGRKDTLSALFFLLTLAAYYGYALRADSWVRSGTLRGFPWWRYTLAVAVFVLGLASKPILVTTPLVLLLLDYWPLRRIPASPQARFSAADLPVLLEKVPLLILSVVSCWLTTWAQASVGAFKALAFPYRLANALISYAAYIGQMFWPAGLMVQYFHKGPSLRLEDTLVPLAALVPLTLAAFWFGRRRRYLLVGWLWYVGMLVPVIGLVQVGAQARADRYTYLTQIGLYIMFAWGVNDLARARRGETKARNASTKARSASEGPLAQPRVRFGLRSSALVGVCAAAAASVLAALAAVAWLQTSYWRDSTTLWAHSVACQPYNDFALNSYGNALNEKGHIDEANRYYRMSIENNPNSLTPRCNLAGNLYKQGKSAEALDVCNAALKVEVGPNDAKVHSLRAAALYGVGQIDASIDEFALAIAKNRNTENTRGDLADAHRNLAEVLRAAKHDLDAAHKECIKALELKPESVDAHRTLGHILLDKGDARGAVDQFRFALRLLPNDLLSREGLAEALWMQGQFRDAIQQFKQLLTAQPQDSALAVSVARRLLSDPRPDARFGVDALAIVQHVCEATEYRDPFALEVLAGAYAETDDFAKAEAAVRKAMETPLGQTPRNAAVLRQRLQLYQAHRKVPLPPPNP